MLSSNNSLDRSAIISPCAGATSVEACCSQRWAQGDVVVVRYADDIILGFQHQTEADRFLENFRERLGKFGLELHPDKTRRIEFGRFAEQNRKRRGEGKPETFDFLGFTHISGKNGLGRFMVRRTTIR